MRRIFESSTKVPKWVNSVVAIKGKEEQEYVEIESDSLFEAQKPLQIRKTLDLLAPRD